MIRKRKSNKLGQGKDPVFVSSPGDTAFFDPLQELIAWCRLHDKIIDDPYAPLFFTDDSWSTCVHTSAIRSEVKKIAVAVGADPNLYGAHSLRIGGATAALAQNVSPALIRLMGRWSSDIYEIYCRMSQQSAVRVGNLIASAHVSPISESFHHEELEYLPQEIEVS